MTKQELIALLEQFPDDTIILVDGHSDGCDFDDACDVEEIVVKKYERKAWSGRYHRPFTGIPHPSDENLPEIVAVRIY